MKPKKETVKYIKEITPIYSYIYSDKGDNNRTNKV